MAGARGTANLTERDHHQLRRRQHRQGARFAVRHQRRLTLHLRTTPRACRFGAGPRCRVRPAFRGPLRPVCRLADRGSTGSGIDRRTVAAQRRARAKGVADASPLVPHCCSVGVGLLLTTARRPPPPTCPHRPAPPRHRRRRRSPARSCSPASAPAGTTPTTGPSSTSPAARRGTASNTATRPPGEGRGHPGRRRGHPRRGLQRCRRGARHRHPRPATADPAADQVRRRRSRATRATASASPTASVSGS